MPADFAGGTRAGKGLDDALPNGLDLFSCSRRGPADQRSRILLDEPSLGLAPQLVEEIFAIVDRLNKEEKVVFLVAEQNTTRRLRLYTRKRPGRHGWQRRRPPHERGCQGILPRAVGRRAKELS